MNSIKSWYHSGESAIWLCAAAVSVSLIIVGGLLGIIGSNGLAHFWPKPVTEFSYRVDQQHVINLIGEVRDEEIVASDRIAQSGSWMADQQSATGQRLLLKIGNREIHGLDFRWIIAGNIEQQTEPENLLVIERLEWGNFYGYLDSVVQGDQPPISGEAAHDALEESIHRALELREQIEQIERNDIGRVNYALEQLRLDQRGLELTDNLTEGAQVAFAEKSGELELEYRALQGELAKQYSEIGRDQVLVTDASGAQKQIAVGQIVRAFYPNSFNLVDKCQFYLEKLWEFVFTAPREANTEGGIFPAIFGTVIMVLIMSVLAVILTLWRVWSLCIIFGIVQQKIC